MAEITFRQALHDTLREELLRDENVFLIGEEIGNFEGFVQDHSRSFERVWVKARSGYAYR